MLKRTQEGKVFGLQSLKNPNCPSFFVLLFQGESKGIRGFEERTTTRIAKTARISGYLIQINLKQDSPANLLEIDSIYP